jgi:hypothetical protein
MICELCKKNISGLPSWSLNSSVIQLCNTHTYHAVCLVLVKRKDLDCRDCRVFKAARSVEFMGNDLLLADYEKSIDLYLQDIVCKPREPRLNLPLTKRQSEQMQIINQSLQFAETRRTNAVYSTILNMLFFLHTVQMAMLIYEWYPCRDNVSPVLIIVQLGAMFAIMINMMDVNNMWYVVALPLCNTWILFILSAVLRYQAFITIPYAFILVMTAGSVRFNRIRHIELISRHDQI